MSIFETYSNKFPKSLESYQKAIRVIPTGGHLSRDVKPFPVSVHKANGIIKTDLDGNELIDYMVGFGALILGNSHPEVTEQVAKQLASGTHMGTLNPLETEWAEMIKKLIPSAQRVRFTGTGTEATLLAMRLARAYTEKNKIVKFREHFHGWHDYASPGAGITEQTGIPQETLSATLVIEPNINALSQVLETRKDIAAVILEPTGGHWGQYPLQNPYFLSNVRDLTKKHNVLMIMDEVICGFRISKGGAQSKFSIMPDLTTMAKIVSGGMPGGAVGGRADIMELLSFDLGSDRVDHHGTYNANPVSACAGIATLKIIDRDPINNRADELADRLKSGLNKQLTKYEVEGHVHGTSSIVHILLGVECSCDGNMCTLDHSEITRSAKKYGPSMKIAMLNEGVDIMGGIGFLLSAVHDKNIIDSTTESFGRALKAIRADGIID